eukprot:SAG25_NODE_8850_length_401_cov_0.513245_1_plen_93_part_01
MATLATLMARTAAKTNHNFTISRIPAVLLRPAFLSTGRPVSSASQLAAHAGNRVAQFAGSQLPTLVLTPLPSESEPRHHQPSFHPPVDTAGK